MATHKPFRELLPPGTNFEFIATQRRWLVLSLLLSLGAIAALFVNQHLRGAAMNWSTDFRGGTEIVMDFQRPGSGEPVAVDLGQVRQSLEEAGHEVEVSDFTWSATAADGRELRHTGVLVRTPEYGAVSETRQDQLEKEFAEAFKDRGVLKTVWSGDSMSVRSTQPLDWKALDAFFTGKQLALKPWDDELTARFTTAEQGTGEYNAQLAIRGIDAQYQGVVAAALGKDVEVKVVNVYGVGAKAGAKLRNDGLASLFYTIVLVMLYLVVRFDVRYAPGAVVAMLHDAIMVIGVFAVTWTEVSLTTVAALLTVVGYSVNDTVIIFDRIRENAHKMKDKRFERVINISINETLSRSLLTSVTVFATTLMMNIFGAGLVRNFAFAMNIGVIVGAYSSVFIASPVVLWIHNKFYSGPPTPGRAPLVIDDASGKMVTVGAAEEA